MKARAIPGIARAVRIITRAVNMLRALHCQCPDMYCCTLFRPLRQCFCMCLGLDEQQGMFLKSKGFLRNAGHCTSMVLKHFPVLKNLKNATI